MRRRRYSIAAMMGVVLGSAVCLAALHSPDPWEGVVYLGMWGVVALAVVGAACGEKAERAWWLGFAAFGLCYRCLISRSAGFFARGRLLPTEALLSRLRVALGGPAGRGEDFDVYFQVGHCLWTLVFAILGGLVALLLFGSTKRSRGVAAEPEPSHEPESPGRSWRVAAFPGGLALLTVAVSFLLRRQPEHCAGGMILFSWGIAGIAALGALFGHGRRRAVCAGVAIFTGGYMYFASNVNARDGPWTLNSTDQFLQVVRPWLGPEVVVRYPASSPSVAAKNAWITRKLERPISMFFAQETPLEEVLKYIAAAVQDPGETVLPISVDPIGLQEADQTPQSKVVIDLEGVPLKTSLRLLLVQLGLVYHVHEGVLTITNDVADDQPIQVDSYLVTGHCLLALFAGWIGGLAAPVAARL
jgi:hypothetical protein